MRTTEETLEHVKQVLQANAYSKKMVKTQTIRFVKRIGIPKQNQVCLTVRQRRTTTISKRHYDHTLKAGHYANSKEQSTFEIARSLKNL